MMEHFRGYEHVVHQNEPLATYTWFRLGGAAQYFAEPTSVEELQGLVRICHREQIPVRLLGGGSNLLVRDEGTPGLVVQLSAAPFSEVTVDGTLVTAGGGAKLGHLVSTAVREGLAGLEAFVGIPGTVGGALHGNAGTADGNIGEWTESATVMTRRGDIETLPRSELRFSYRQSSLDDVIILSARFQLERGEVQALTQRMQKVWITKQQNRPSGYAGGASVFKDPIGASAADLIEQAGLKGTRVGQAEISELNPNFIVIHNGATAQDVLRLIELVKSRLSEAFGVELETEIEIW